MKPAHLLFILVSLVLVGCGHDSPATPSNTIPEVAGSYAGTASIAYTTLGQTLNCPMTTTVVQNGYNVNVAPLTFGGNCASLGSLPVGDTTMTNTGSLGSTSTTLSLASCGGTYNAVGSGGFFGRTLQFSFVYTALSGNCVRNPGNFSITGNLSR